MSFIISGADNQNNAGGDLIKETTTQTFVADVIEASKEVPVLVDFWAPWCGPCKQLTPRLEQAVTNAGGKVKLVKMNIDQYPEVAGQLGIQSIPAVFAFKDGRPVDGFMGAVGEGELRQFIDRITAGEGGGVEQQLEAAETALAQDNVNEAANLFAEVLQSDKENVNALAGLAKCYIKSGDLDRAEQMLGMVPAGQQMDSAVTSAKAMLDLARKSEEAADTSELEQKVADDPADLQARFDLALALQAKGKREAAMEQLLEIVKRDREWNEGAARQQLVEFFDAWGANDPLTVKGRQRLSGILFS
ncbi:thioredoxin [Dichotomicrobium thermohalophilum]|uniref:Thioredoxin n=1 Tax=Dichotomicrobium thermohalophilum TaxID=933063 RepID=A0A397Q560_9HYPH|nr:thioredoxin [Dichotomicrobium thermohalophilum]RIA55559.1 thioredoxin [Dichotomicrobium thermohalophilum]